MTRIPAITESQLFQQTIVRLKQGWTKEHYARDEHGHRALPCHPTAVCWCIRGAMTRSFYDLTGIDPVMISPTHRLKQHLRNVRTAVEFVVEELLGRPDVVTLNDEYLRHFQEAVAVVERADRQFHSQ